MFMGTLSLKLNVLKFTFHSRKKDLPYRTHTGICSLYFSLSFPVNMFYTFLFAHSFIFFLHVKAYFFVNILILLSLLSSCCILCFCTALYPKVCSVCVHFFFFIWFLSFFVCIFVSILVLSWQCKVWYDRPSV